MSSLQETEMEDRQELSDPNAPANTGGNGARRPGVLRKGSAFRKFLPVLFLVLVVAAVLFWVFTRGWESTDDAQIDGHIYSVSSRFPEAC